MTAAERYYPELIQGSDEWLQVRKGKITATDAAIIMGLNPWKNKQQLYQEKTSDIPQVPPTERMLRGLNLEPIARDLFCLQTGYDVKPTVVVSDWLMASLDGMSDDGSVVVEIKCPAMKYHELALNGKIPDHYYPQLQHQMNVCGIDKMWYFSFDGADGVSVPVFRDQVFIDTMLREERSFYECIANRTPPDDGFVTRNDDVWVELASRWVSLKREMKLLEQEEEALRDRLVFLSAESNTRGAGIALTQVTRKGCVDYGKVPGLRSMDLDVYRKSDTTYWKITEG